MPATVSRWSNVACSNFELEASTAATPKTVSIARMLFICDSPPWIRCGQGPDQEHSQGDDGEDCRHVAVAREPGQVTKERHHAASFWRRCRSRAIRQIRHSRLVCARSFQMVLASVH